MTYTVALREVHEIELSSRCNLACKYCPHPELDRPKEDMTDDTYAATLELVKELCRRNTQGEVAFTGIGEALFHPSWEEHITAMRSVVGPRPITLSTNGILVTDKVARGLAKLDIRVFVSLHRPELAAPAIERLKAAGCWVHTNHAFVDSALDWAGQVKWAVSMPRSECQYLRRGWGVVREDGRITTCCMDAHTRHSFGTVRDPVDRLILKSHKLCGQCSLDIPVTVD